MSMRDVYEYAGEHDIPGKPKILQFWLALSALH